MNLILDKSLSNIMTTDIKSLGPQAIGSEIAEIFEKNDFHHIPVVADEKPIGIISMSDYRQLQHHFTRLKIAQSQVQNEKFFRSILAKEIMSLDPVCMEENKTIGDAVEVFIKNKIHAIIVCREGKICGIVTPIDILKSVVYPALIDK